MSEVFSNGNPVIINKVVETNQIDHNNHMHDSEYNKVFSEL